MGFKHFLASLILCALFGHCAMSVAAPVSAEAVQNAIDKGVAFLYASQKNDSWEATPARDGTDHDWKGYQGDTWGGQTDMAVYALLAAGERPTDPRLAKAIDFLKRADQVGVYNLGVRCVVWSMLPQTPEIRKLLVKDAMTLVSATKAEGVGHGFYHYLPNGEGKDYDLSISQFAVLGVWAAVDAGVEIPDAYWQKIDAAWRNEQFPDGGWAYARQIPKYNYTTVTMTGAGVATLFVTQDHLRANTGVCKGSPVDKNVELGISMIEKNFTSGITQSPRKQWPTQYYCMFGIERIGVASGYKHFGNVDWFNELASTLIPSQQPDGRWSTGIYDVANTSFAIIALARGRAPVVINKLRYTNATPDKPASEKTERWNQRPRDVANFVRWMGRQSEASLNWQIVSLDAPVEELNDAPVIYISGDDVPTWSAAQLAKLRTFIEGGGMVLANADCGGAKFTDAIKKAAKDLFPDYEWHELPAGHPIYTRQLYDRSKWKNKPSVLGLSNGDRELMVIVPTADLGKAFQTESVGGKAELYQLTGNIVRYAGGADVTRRPKGSSRPTMATTQPTRTISVARVQYKGNWNPEPGGWTRMAKVLSQKLAGLDVKAIAPSTATPLAGNVAHLTGTYAFKLTAEERAAIQKFVKDGGTLVVDAAGGASDFAASAETELEATFPGFVKAPVLGADHAAFAGVEGLANKIKYREFGRTSVGKTAAPKIRGFDVGNRTAVFFSREDLSVGLVGMSVDGIIGYEPETATSLMQAILLYAAGPAK